MHKIIAGGTGLIGSSLVNDLLKESCRVSVIGRSKAKIESVFGNRVSALEWSELTPQHFLDADLVVNLAGAGISDKLWSKAYKKEILTSRLQATEHLATLLATLGDRAPALFNASAIGVYGLQAQSVMGLPPRLDENTTIDFDKSTDFLSHVAREWEKATSVAKENGVRVVNLRFGVVLSKSGGALPQMARPYYMGLGGPVGKGKQPFSWITLQDLLSALHFLSKHPALTGPVNLVSPGCVTQRVFAKTLGKVLRKPSVFVLPAFAIKVFMGEMGRELLLDGQHVFPKRLVDAGFQFSAPDIATALTEIYQK